MRPDKRALTIFITLICALCMLPTFAIAKSAVSTEPQLFVFREHGTTQTSVLYADGSTVSMQTESVTWPTIGSDTSKTTPEQFKASVLRARDHFATTPKTLIQNTGASGLVIQFVVTSPPPGAQAALNAVASYIGSLFLDPITVTINIDFQSMDPGILGATTSHYAGSVTYANTRTGLVNGMDSDDTLLTYLPTGSTIPVRYNIASGTATDESRVFFTVANYRATIGTLSGTAADMTINSDFSWDYDPSDGISSGCFCFRSVVAHEVGHVLGFTSGADFRNSDIEALDLFRFQDSNYNPSTNAQFQTMSRLVWLDESGSSYDDCNSDLITVEYEMSDGYPYQASHFSQGNVDAIMQPAFSYGQTFYPNYYLTPDKKMFDMIGWDNSGGQQGAPNRPDQPTGQTNGYQNTEYSYTSKTTDPDGDQVYYLWDWGDGTQSSWIGPKTSGQSITTPHTYQSSGSFSVRVKAKDTHGLESDWSPALPVTMPLDYPGGWQHGQLINFVLRILHLLFPSLGGVTLP
jgi:hypothetical protein